MFRRDKKHKQANTNKEQDKAFIQPKLKMGKAGDAYEVEADKMADKVVNNSSSDAAVQRKGNEEEVQQKPLASEVTPLVQKKEAADEEQPIQKMEEEEAVQSKEDEEVQKMEEEEAVQSKEDEEVQMMEEEEAVQSKEEEEVQAKCAACEGEEKAQKKEDEEVQKKQTSTTPNSGNNSFESRLKRGSGGHKLDSQTKQEMESGFGADFSNVNIHNDTEAEQMSSDIGAQAFTHGNDIYFNKGKYNPNSKEGKHLLAHELTHTIQQKGMVQKKVQKQEMPSYTCSGKAKRGTITPRIKISGFTDAPMGTKISFHYLSGAGCSSSHMSIVPFGSARVTMLGYYSATFTSMMTMMPPIGATFIAVIGNTNSYCCITVKPMR